MILALMIAGCTYEPPVYRGEIETAEVLDSGRVAIAYSQKVSRRPTGLSAWPDGGKAQIDHDQFLVAVLDPGGGTREIARFDNEALPGNGAVALRWFEADPGHLYISHVGQLTSELPMRRLNQIRRMNFQGKEVARFDPLREMAAEGRNYIGLRSAEAGGSILAVASRGGVREMWRRDVGGNWTLLDQFDGDFKVVGDDLVYRQVNYELARNWRSGKVRKLVHYDPATRRSVKINPADPALAYSGYEATIRARPSSDRKAIYILRDNDRIASITPDFQVLDRR